MRIIDQRDNEVSFGKIKIGEVFEYSGFFYLKTGSSFDKENCVSLDSGKFRTMLNTEYVVGVEAELVIKGDKLYD